MIKKLLYTVLLFAALGAKGQTLPIGAPNGTVEVKGKLAVDSLFLLPLRTDTMFTPSRAGAIVFAYGQAYLYVGNQWARMTGIAWGTIPGNLSDQVDLIDSLNRKQTLLSNGYGWLIVNGSGVFDSAHVRKLDTVYAVNDSTVGFTVNKGSQQTFKIRGTAAGASVLSINLLTPAGLFVAPVSFASDSAGHWADTLVLAPQAANTVFAGPPSGAAGQPAFRVLNLQDLPTNIPNGNLQNSTIGLQIGFAGSQPNFSATSVAIGNNIILNLPTASATITGILSAFDWNRFNNAIINQVTSVNGQHGAVVTRNADSLGAFPIDFTNFHNGWVLSVSPDSSKLQFNAPGSGSGIVNLNGQTQTTQSFAVGQTGTSVNIQSVGGVHTVNVPIVNGADSGIVTPGLYNAWQAKQPALSGTGYLKLAVTTPSYLTPAQVTADLSLFSPTLQGLVPLSGGGTTNVLYADGTWRTPPDSTVYYSKYRSDTARANLYAALTGKMNNYGGAPGWLVGTYAGIPTASTYIAGTHYTAKDSGFIYIDTGSGGTAGWKKISGGGTSGGSTAGLVANFLNSQQLGYGLYASKPTTGTGFYYASDSLSWFYVNGATATNITSFSVGFRGKGQPGDTAYVFGRGSSIYVAAQRDSAGRALHHVINADSSRTAYIDFATSSLPGIVPASGGGTGKFLQADFSWAVPTGTSEDTTNISHRVDTVSSNVTAIEAKTNKKAYDSAAVFNLRAGILGSDTNYVNVINFTGVPDGVHDNSTGLQNAANYAAAHNKNLLVPAYIFIDSVQINMPTTGSLTTGWRFMPGGIIEYSMKTGRAINYQNAAFHDILIENPQMQSIADTTSLGNTAIYFSSTTQNTIIKRVRILGGLLSVGQAVLGKGLQDFEMSGVFVRSPLGHDNGPNNSNPAVQVRPIDDSVGDENKRWNIHDCFFDGYSGSASVTTLKTLGPMDGAFYGHVSGLMLHDNYFNRFGQEPIVYQPDITLTDTLPSSINNNHVYCYIPPGSKTPSGVKIQANVGIRAEGQNLIISDNEIWGATNGISVNASATWNYTFRNLVIKHNTVHMTTDTALIPGNGVDFRGYNGTTRWKQADISDNTIIFDSTTLKQTATGVYMIYVDSAKISGNHVVATRLTKGSFKTVGIYMNQATGILVNNNTTIGVDTVLSTPLSTYDNDVADTAAAIRAGLFYQTVAANATPVTQRKQLNFGNEFSAVDDASGGGRTDVTIYSIPGSKITGLLYQTVQANGTGVPQEPILNLGSEFNTGDDPGSTRTDVVINSISGAKITLTTQAPKDSSLYPATTQYVDKAVAAGGTGSSFYQTMQANGTPLTQRAALNFGSEFSTVDDGGNGRSDVTVSAIAESKVTNLTTDLAAKAPLASPALTGTPTVPTATLGTNTTQAASTAFVTAAVGALNVSSGGYTPVQTTGLAGTSYSGLYTRIGNVVTFDGAFGLTGATSTAYTITLSVPVSTSSSFTSNQQILGAHITDMGYTTQSTNMSVTYAASVSGGAIILKFTAPDTNAHIYSYHYSYLAF